MYEHDFHIVDQRGYKIDFTKKEMNLWMNLGDIGWLGHPYINNDNGYM